MEARALRRQTQKCTLGCPVLDRALHGGIPCGSLTELVGESASGKTQLSLQLLLTVQLPVAEGGLYGSALYIYTESSFSCRRLQQLARTSLAAQEKKRHPGRVVGRALSSLDVNTMVRRNVLEESCPKKGFLCGVREDEARDHDSSAIGGPPDKLPVIDDALDSCSGAIDPCQNIFVQGIQKADELLEYLDHAVSLLEHPFLMPVRLIVIDSMAALFRSDFENNARELRERSSLFFKIASKLKRLAEKFNLAVVVTNQITDFFETIESSRNDTLGLGPGVIGSQILVSSGRRVAPALGLAWAHCVNTRLFLSRTLSNDDSLRRSIHVVFAPHLPNVSRDFVVSAPGVRGIQTKRKSVVPYCKQVDYRSPVDNFD